MQMILSTSPNRRPSTRAAEGLPRWRWTVAEIERMAVDGYFRDDERFELVGGEIVPMSPKGNRHERIRGVLTQRLTRQTTDDVFVISEPQLNLDDETYVHPDILVHPEAIMTADIRGRDALLVVEISDTSLRYDLDTKAPLYAASGVREYWVINAVTLTTRVHREPSGRAYASVTEFGANDTLSPMLLPQFSVSLRALDLKLD